MRVGHAFLTLCETPHRTPLHSHRPSETRHASVCLYTSCRGISYLSSCCSPHPTVALSTGHATGARHWVQPHYPLYTMHIISLHSRQAAPYTVFPHAWLKTLDPPPTSSHTVSKVFCLFHQNTLLLIEVLHVQMNSAVLFYNHFINILLLLVASIECHSSSKFYLRGQPSRVIYSGLYRTAVLLLWRKGGKCETECLFGLSHTTAVDTCVKYSSSVNI